MKIEIWSKGVALRMVKADDLLAVTIWLRAT